MNSLMCVVSIVLVTMVVGCQKAGGPMERVSERGVLFRTVTAGGIERKYAVYVPREYSPGQPTPLIVFLNGSGECGTDGQKQLTQGLIPAVLSDPGAWPFIIVCPQKPDSKTQWIDHDELVMAVLAAAKDHWNIDTSRMYLTGLSQGGAGTWEVSTKHSGMFAAIAPICGYGSPTAELGKALKSTPIWAFHGAKDDVVVPAKAEALVASVKAAGGDPKFTLFPDANHNSWDAAYRTQKLGEWFLSHHK